MVEIRVGELEDFASRFFPERGGDDLIPITPQRARAQVNNPCADPEDITLFAAYSGKRLIGYLGALPGWLRRGERLTKVNWGSTWFLLPEFRKSGAGFLLGRNFKSRLRENVFTNLSPEAWQIISLLSQRRELGSCLYYKLSLRRFPRPWRATAYKFLLPGPPTGFVGRETGRVRAEQHPLVRSGSPPAEFYRGPEVVNWMLKYPWVAESGSGETGTNSYFFSDRRKLFKMFAVEVLGRGGGGYRGFFVCSLSATGRDRILKILDYDFLSPEDRSLVLPLALERARKHGADLVYIPGELLEKPVRGALLRLLARPRLRPYLYYPAASDSPLALAAGEIRLAYCDGDTAFT